MPRIYLTNTDRTQCLAAVQVLEYMDCPAFRLHAVAYAIGQFIARWQSTPVTGFGPFWGDCTGELKGYHSSYEHYFRLHLAGHQFLSKSECDEIRSYLHLQSAAEGEDLSGMLLGSVEMVRSE